MPWLDVDVSALLADALIVDFAPLVGTHWGKDNLPRLDGVFYSAATSLAIDLYEAPGALSLAQNRIPIIVGTLASAARSCFPLWVDPTTRAPWGLRMSKPAGLATLRVEWSRNGGGF